MKRPDSHASAPLLHRNKVPGLCAGAALLVAAGSIALAQAPAPTDLPAFYRDNCAGCHGADGAALDAQGKPLRGQDLTDEKWRQGTSEADIVRTILKGKFFGLAMPAYKDKLTREEAERLATEVIRRAAKGTVIQPAADAAQK
jgi:mono/diheme cytochrome c family protein